jgi:hypothetical protein
MAEQNDNLARDGEFDLTDHDVPGGSAEEIPAGQPSADYAGKTDALIAKEGEVTGQPVDGWQVLSKIQDFENYLGIQIDDAVRNDILAVLRDNQANPQQALQDLKNGKYADQLYQPVAELLDTLTEHYSQIEEDVNALRSDVAEAIEEVNDVDAFENEMSDSLKDSLFPHEKTEISDEMLKAASRIRNIFYTLREEVLGTGLITSDPEELQSEIDGLAQEHGFNPEFFSASINKYISLLSPEEELPSDEEGVIGE